MLLLLLLGQGVIAPGVDVAEVLRSLLPSLGASDYLDLVFWDQAQLYAYADEALERLARRTGLFVVRDSINITQGQAVYELPAGHVSTIRASLSGLPLREASIEELEALDRAWRVRTGTPRRITEGDGGLHRARLYPKPVSDGSLAVVFHRRPAAVQPESSQVEAPPVVADYIALSVLAEAFRRDGEASKPEVSAHLDQRLALMEEVFRAYWGTAQ